MTIIKTTTAIAAGIAALALLSGCDQAKPRPGAEGAAPAAAAAPPVAEALPPVPTWAQAVLGQTLKTAFPAEGACDGNTDSIELRGPASAPGASILGWAWDPATKAPVGRIVLVDKDQKIVGGGESGLPRSDVRSARPDITSDATGWRGVAAGATGGIDAYGLVGDGTATCKLGHIEL
jgi:hypothetical protein